MTDPLRVILVGVGRRSASWVKAFAAVPEWEPVALVDVDPQLLEAAGEATGVPEDACFSRRSPFGVIRTSGRATASSACRRSRWKYCAAVVQFATRMFSWAPSWRNRSSRALECSGPFPS